VASEFDSCSFPPTVQLCTRGGLPVGPEISAMNSTPENAPVFFRAYAPRMQWVGEAGNGEMSPPVRDELRHGSKRLVFVETFERSYEFGCENHNAADFFLQAGGCDPPCLCK
jgi:hypothetical protein